MEIILDKLLRHILHSVPVVHNRKEDQCIHEWKLFTHTYTH